VITPLWIRARSEHDLRRLAGRGRRFQCGSCDAVCALRKTHGRPTRVVFREGGLWVERFHACTFSGSDFALLIRILARLAAVLEFAQPTEGKDFGRASGNVICQKCGAEYWRHPPDPLAPYLTMICDPPHTRVKL